MRCLAAEEKHISCGDASLARSAVSNMEYLFMFTYWFVQKRESTATVKNPPTPYVWNSPPTRQVVIEFDCRGLEFTEFKADV